MISSRAVAVQGFGYVPLFVAMQGLVAYEVPSPVAPPGVAARLPVPAASREQLLAEDELLVLMLAQIAASGLLN